MTVSFLFVNLKEADRQGTVNRFTGAAANSDPAVLPRQSLYGLCAQDDFRLSPKLTLNLGPRYEFTSTPYVLHGRVSNLHNYLTRGQMPDNLISGNSFFLNPSHKNFALRVGFAWDPTGSSKTSICGGVGRVLGGWQTSGIVTAQSGMPFDVSSGALPIWMRSGFVGNYPDRVLGTHVQYNERNPDHYLEPSTCSTGPTLDVPTPLSLTRAPSYSTRRWGGSPPPAPLRAKFSLN